jgi:hypothetical protein
VEAAENKRAMRRITEHAINEKNLDAAYELFSDEHELHPETPGIGRGRGNEAGLRGLARTVSRRSSDGRVDGRGRGHGCRSPYLMAVLAGAV